MSRAIQHSAASVEHYGPDFIGPLVREVFGGPIDLDPASCAQANTLIGAEHFYTKEENGISLPWFGNVYLNPPGGRVDHDGNNYNQAALWYACLSHRYSLGLVSQAVFMVFNLELFRYAQRWTVPQPLDYPSCFPKERLDFWKPGDNGLPQTQGSPGHPNAILYMGRHVERFKAVFSKLGKVYL